MPKRFTIKHADLMKHGFSMGCSGCKSILKGTSRQAHAEECRKRLASEMKGEDRVTTADAKMDELSPLLSESLAIRSTPRRNGGDPR